MLGAQRSCHGGTASRSPRSFIWDQLENLAPEYALSGGRDQHPVRRMADMDGPITLPPYLPRASTLDDLAEAVNPAPSSSTPLETPTSSPTAPSLPFGTTSCPRLTIMLLDHLPGEERKYYAVDRAFTEAGDPAQEATSEFLRTVELPGIPSLELHLKVGAPVMLMRNMNPRVGLCNGTWLIITRLERKAIEGRILTGDFKGSPTLYSTYPPIFPRRGAPVDCEPPPVSSPPILCHHHQ